MNTVIAGVLLLVIGGVIGYTIGTDIAVTTVEPEIEVSSDSMHVMPDGTVMGNEAETMSMAEMMASMNAELAGKSGTEFNEAFLREMIVHHQGAVEMAELALLYASDTRIIELANAIIAAQNTEIGMMEDWLAE